MKNRIGLILVATLLAFTGCANTPPQSRAPVFVKGEPSHAGIYIPMVEADVKPAPKFMKKPIYPAHWRSSGIEGNAVTDFIVDEHGIPTEVQILHASDQAFADSAIEAMQQWRFTPGSKNGHFVRVHMQIPMVFTLNEGG